MSTNISVNPWKACLEPVTVGPSPGRPPATFLDMMLAVVKTLPDEIFAPNPIKDIYSIVSDALGPFVSEPGQIQRRAAMMEVLRVDAGFESGWNWNEGADSTAGYETPEEQETGAWQVSANSMAFDASLKACVQRLTGGATTSLFIADMKHSRFLAVEYAARLFRFNTRWSGPSNRGWIARAVSREAASEFQSLLASGLTPA